MNKPLYWQMQELGLSQSDLLKRVNLIAARNIKEEAKMLSHSEKEQSEYIASHRSGISRKTLYNILNTDSKVSTKTAMLVLQTINEIRRRRGLKDVSLNNLGLEVFKRWE